MKVVDKVCPEKRNAFKEVSLSSQTMTRRIEDIGEDLENQLQLKAEKFVAFSLAIDESTDIIHFKFQIQAIHYCLFNFILII